VLAAITGAGFLIDTRGVVDARILDIRRLGARGVRIGVRRTADSARIGSGIRIRVHSGVDRRARIGVTTDVGARSSIEVHASVQEVLRGSLRVNPRMRIGVIAPVSGRVTGGAIGGPFDSIRGSR